MFQSRYATPPLCPPDGFFNDTTVHLELADPALIGNWLLLFLREWRCIFVRIDFFKCTIRVHPRADPRSLIKMRVFYDRRNSTPVSIEFQLYPKGDVEIFVDLFRATKEYLEEAVETANILRSYAAGYTRMGRLQRAVMPVPVPWPVRDNVEFYDLPPLENVDNTQIEDVD